MINSLVIKIILLLVIIVCLIAPFTFLKPKFPDDALNISSSKNRSKIISEKPLHSVQLPNFASIKDSMNKKRAFFDFLKPVVIKQNKAIIQTRKKIETWIKSAANGIKLSEENTQQLNNLVKKYRIDKTASITEKLNALLVKVDIIPMPLVLVQAANESAWGTSRFARIGLNFFGIWCYQKGCGMIPKNRNTGAKHEVAAFKSVNQAVSYYFENINTNNAYKELRSIRSNLRAQQQPLTAERLVAGLLRYSERGSKYVEELTHMLRQNKKLLQ